LEFCCRSNLGGLLLSFILAIIGAWVFSVRVLIIVMVDLVLILCLVFVYFFEGLLEDNLPIFGEITTIWIVSEA